MRTIINIKLPEAERLLKELEYRNDSDSLRMKRFLNMPDLSRTSGSPVHEIVKRILRLPNFKDMDVINVPEIVPTSVSFDLFDFPKDHPTRSKSDTYYVDDKNILRTQTTVMWYYYLNNEEVKARIAKNEPVGSFSFGKVYRKDEIDRNHMNVFHQIDGWYLARKDQKIITTDDLHKVLSDIAKAVFGPNVKYRLNSDTFPYTDPSLEMEIDKDGNDTWTEVLGAGMVKGKVLDNLGVDSSEWNGWAFGFGLERLAILSMHLPDIRLLWSEDERVKKQLRLGNKYKEVSKFPPITRDISFVVDKSFTPNNYYDLIRDLGGGLVEEVKLLDTYHSPDKFGTDKISYTFRIIYRSNERTLLSKEVDSIQNKIYQETKNQFKAQIR